MKNRFNSKGLSAHLWIRVFLLVVLSVSSIFSAGPASLASAAPDTEQANAPQLGSAYPGSSVITGVSFDWATHKRLAPAQTTGPSPGLTTTTSIPPGAMAAALADQHNSRVSLGFARIRATTSYQGVQRVGRRQFRSPAQFDGKSCGLLPRQHAVHLALRRRLDATAYRSSACTFRAITAHLELHRRGVQPRHFPGTDNGFFCPTFLQFGKNYAGARDSYVYSYAPEIRPTPGICRNRARSLAASS